MGDTLVCTSVTASTAVAVLADFHKAAAAGADLVELRVDLLDAGEDWEHPLSASPLPVIVTNRAAWEGGQCTLPEADRLATLVRAEAAGAAFVDVELAAAAPFQAARASSGAPPSRGGGKGGACRLILSHHNFERPLTHDEASKVYADAVAAGADIVKVAMAATSAADVGVVFDLLSAAKVPTIALAMGAHGVISRILTPKYGGFLTFTCVAAGAESAPGQLDTATLLSAYPFRSITPATAVYGVIGCPIGHSMSPALHNAALSAAAIDAVYVPLLVDGGDLDRFLTAVRPHGFVGFSVTLPHKLDALAACGDAVDPVAARIGAVNTLVADDGGPLGYRGYNTDWTGALDAVEARRTVRDASVMVLGAGGAGRALAFGAVARGAGLVIIVNRSGDKARALAAELRTPTCPTVATTPDAATDLPFVAGVDIVMNSTSVGMHPGVDATPVDAALFVDRGAPLVFDAVYNPLETRLLREAAAAGCVTVSGVEMFVRQAAAQFQLWFPERTPDVGLMREVVLAALAKKK
ncbi:hypothetical protein BU14_0673s0005 [Porphyra umbilicalis]|uniref:shikimate dehydrogenase (NADP(+)) n=1 Tax=Porphyra umbilicalis TaxID=2786 RepID=A0A1X6NQT8_PORUM|nr:hypothetical protein BU14_0673s0005 [Porphyra umbilicalis]|eukprot:OSX70753.1 hypothetical protein BU14_0673s0005 [Porphyra umbilicalis]